MKKLGLTLVALLAVFTMTGCNDKAKEPTKNNEPKIVANTNTGVITEQTVEGLKFDNVALIRENGQTTLSTNVTNTTTEVIELTGIKVTFAVAETVLTSIMTDIGDSIAANATTNIRVRTDVDLMDADAITYEIVK